MNILITNKDCKIDLIPPKQLKMVTSIEEQKENSSIPFASRPISLKKPYQSKSSSSFLYGLLL